MPASLMPGTPLQPIPAKAGIGLRAAHHAEFLQLRPMVPWVEVHSENFFADGGRQLEILQEVSRNYGVSLHGVGLSLGSTDPLDVGHLRRLQRLVERVNPALVSEHLSWSSAGGEFLNDLLPLPATSEALAHMVERVGHVQDILGRQILVENVSSYIQFGDGDMPEWEFVTRLALEADCRILLDVNNIYVNARNHGFNALDYLNAIPVDLVAEMHLAGHTVVPNGGEDLLIDTHDAPVAGPVWVLYAAAVRRFGRLPTLLEWDSHLPPLAELVGEAQKADRLMEMPHARVA